jgi:CheY-like chemotaxis protein
VRILIADDDPSSVDALCELLESEGHRVVRAENGVEALARLREGDEFCVILLDLMMPVMDGYEFREQQLHDPELAGIPVILVTADTHARAKAAEMHTEGFFQKPLRPPDLLRAVRAFCPS